MTIDTATKRLTTTITGGTGNLNIDLTADSVSQLSKLITVLNRTPYTCIGPGACNTGQYIIDPVNGNCLWIKPQTAVDIKTDNFTESMDLGRYYRYEIASGKAMFESQIPGFTCKTFQTPCGTSIDTALRAMRGFGFTSNRNTATPVSTINQQGVFTAGETAEECTVTATVGSVHGDSSVSVVESISQNQNRFTRSAFRFTV